MRALLRRAPLLTDNRFASVIIDSIAHGTGLETCHGLLKIRCCIVLRVLQCLAGIYVERFYYFLTNLRASNAYKTACHVHLPKKRTIFGRERLAKYCPRCQFLSHCTHVCNGGEKFDYKPHSGALSVAWVIRESRLSGTCVENGEQEPPR